MKRIALLTFALILGLNTFAQGRRDRMGNPVINREPTKEEIAKYEQKVEERKDEYIANFLTTLEADDFQKEIIKQKIYSFFDAKIAIFKTQYDHNLDRKEAIKKLEENHFKELEELISENDMKKVREMIKGDFDEKEVIKDKKKKKRKKRKDKDN